MTETPEENLFSTWLSGFQAQNFSGTLRPR